MAGVLGALPDGGGHLLHRRGGLLQGRGLLLGPLGQADVACGDLLGLGCHGQARLRDFPDQPLQLLAHALHGVEQHAGFVPGEDLDLVRQVALGDVVGDADRLVQRHDDGPDDQVADQARQGDGDDDRCDGDAADGLEQGGGGLVLGLGLFHLIGHQRVGTLEHRLEGGLHDLEGGVEAGFELAGLEGGHRGLQAVLDEHPLSGLELGGELGFTLADVAAAVAVPEAGDPRLVRFDVRGAVTDDLGGRVVDGVQRQHAVAHDQRADVRQLGGGYGALLVDVEQPVVVLVHPVDAEATNGHQHEGQESQQYGQATLDGHVSVHRGTSLSGSRPRRRTVRRVLCRSA